MTKKNTDAARAPETTAVQIPKVEHAVTVPPDERKVRAMDIARFRGEEFLRSKWLATAFEHTTPEDLLKPDYWAHVSTHLRPRDRIEAWADDGTWMAEYVVLEAGRNWARLSIVSVHRFTNADQAMTHADALAPYEITHRGVHSKWSVIRKSDRQVMSEGYDTMRGATDWLAEHMKALDK